MLGPGETFKCFSLENRGLIQNSTEASGSVPDSEMLQMRLSLQGGEFKWPGRASLATPAFGAVHGHPACREEKPRLSRRTDLPADVFLSDGLLWFVCIQNLGFYRPLLICFCTNNICLRGNVFEIKTLLILTNRVGDSSKAKKAA